jgi:hypothetical protein
MNKRITVAMAFVRMPTAQSPQSRGRLGEQPAYTYFRCMASAYGSVRRFNPDDVDLVLVTTEHLPEPYSGQLAAMGVETVLKPFTHCPPEGFGRGWVSSLFHLDAMAALADRDCTLVFIEPDMLCVRPLDALLAAVGDAVGVQSEVLDELFVSGASVLDEYQETCAEMHRDLGEETVEHGMYSGSFYVLPSSSLPILLERIDRAWALALERNQRGQSVFYTDEHFMNYAVRGVEVKEMSEYVRLIGTAPWRRLLTDRKTILGLTLWNLTHEKDLGFQRMYRDAIDPASWFWTAPPEEFRERAGAIMSATQRSPQRALLNAAGDLVERGTTERMQHRLKPLYTRMVQLYSSMRPV